MHRSSAIYKQKQFKNTLMMDVKFGFKLIKLIDGLEWCGVDYLWIIVMFLSTVWTFILTAPIHCNDEQMM